MGNISLDEAVTVVKSVTAHYLTDHTQTKGEKRVAQNMGGTVEDALQQLAAQTDEEE